MKQTISTLTLALLLIVSARGLHAQSKSDTVAIQALIENEVMAWNKGDAVAYSRQFAQKGTFTNIQGMFFMGHEVFMQRHEQIFNTVFSKTVLQLKMVALQFVRPDVAVVETLSMVSGFAGDPPLGARLDAKGRLVTRLLQVVVKESADWKIVAYHNVDVKPGVLIPE